MGIQTFVMKKQTAFNKAMIYDDHCPLCRCYTGAFVKTGLLRKENRIAFSELDTAAVTIDWDRARHEIPLVDMDTRQVAYGIDALVTVLQQKFPFIGYFIKIKPVDWFFRKLYKLVSYNRRIIVAGSENGSCGFDCRPDFNLTYRVLLVSVLLVMSSCFLLAFAAVIALPTAIVYSNFIVPLLLVLFAKRETQTWSLSAQYGIIAVIASFLLFLTGCMQKIFSGSFPTVLYTGTGVIICIVVQQIIRRIQFIKKDRMHEMQ